MMRPYTWRPATDVYETDEAVIVRVEVAGMLENDFSLQIKGRHFVIQGIRSDIQERRAYHQMEIRFGEFEIELELPHSIDATNIEALYENGFLRVTLPKATPRQITITL